jgi:hypothetical protein
VGTFAGALRIGDVFSALAPGEVFPRINDLLRGGGVVAQDHLFFGATNDFLGYMVDGEDAYFQALQEGATFLAGCPEEEVIGGDPACPDHFTLMVSPTIGTHVLCTIQNAAQSIGLETGPRNPRCAVLTALDGVAGPAEAVPADGPGADGPGGSSGPGSSGGSGGGQSGGAGSGSTAAGSAGVAATQAVGRTSLPATGPPAAGPVLLVLAGLLVALRVRRRLFEPGGLSR